MLLSFELIYRASLYLNLTLAALLLSIDKAEEESLVLVYPALVAAAGVLALLTVDRRPRMGLGPALANPLGLASIALAYLEYRSEPSTRLVLALGHLLIYLQLIKMFQTKRTADDWYLLLLSVVEVVVGSYLGVSETVGLLLMAWVLTALWALMLGHLFRESCRARGATGMAVTPLGPRNDPYPGLFGAEFFATALGVVFVTLVFGGLVFLAMPRRADALRQRQMPTKPQHLTGFSEEVQLGQLGEILENDAIVMTIEAYDSQGNLIRPDEETLWRGITLANYGDGRWTRSSDDFALIEGESITTSSERLMPLRRYRIKLEPTNNLILFASRPVLKASGVTRNQEPTLNRLDGTLRRPSVEGDHYEYDIWTTQSPDAVQPGEIDPRAYRRLYASLIGIRRGLSEMDTEDTLETRLEALAERLFRERVIGQDPISRAKCLEAFLRDSNTFHYSLVLERHDRDLDPVEDFLVNTRQGNCEYFASALTLLLRASRIPARMVNGFKGGDWNALSSTMFVRQKHAHSWVEALVGYDEANRPIWIELDPTPPDERAEVVRRVGGGGFQLRFLSDYLRKIWVSYLLLYNAENQERWIYGPVRRLFEEKAYIGFRIMYGAARRAMRWLFDFPSASSFFSIRGFLVSVSVMLALLILMRLVLRVGRRLFRWLRGDQEQDDGLSIKIAFYRRAMHLLTEAGLRRLPTETPKEFAQRAALFLMARDPNSCVADVPPEIVESYYGLRFGRIVPTERELHHLEARLQALEARLRGPNPY